jgi:hypothetical protein
VTTGVVFGMNREEKIMKRGIYIRKFGAPFSKHINVVKMDFFNVKRIHGEAFKRRDRA